MRSTRHLRGIAVLAACATVAGCPAAAAGTPESKLTIAPPLVTVTVTPPVAGPGVARRITVGGVWPNGCAPVQALLGAPLGTGKPALGVLLAEPLTLAPCTAALTPYRFELDYTPQSAGQLDILVMTSQARALGSGKLVTGSAAEPRARYDIAGAWYDPQTSGSGLMVAHDYGQSDAVFATWQIYDASNGSPRWYSVQLGRWQADGLTWEGTLYETRALPVPCLACPVAAEQITERGRVRLTVGVNGASGGLDGTLDLLVPGGPPQRLANLRRFLPDRILLQ